MKNKIVQDMNMIWVLKKAIGITLFSCVMAACVFGKDAAISVTVSNPLVIDRPNEMIIIQWNEINKCLHNLKMETIHVFEAKTHKELCIQIIKENGEPTELLFLASFITHETKEFIIEFSTKERMATEPLTDARFMPRREDIAWENDRIAYRIYGPALAWELNNGFDVWTKRVRYPIVEKWYRLDEADTLHRISYHEDHGEGADLFETGRSLGDGSCALIRNDSLLQPGVFSTYKILATGPIRAVFEVTYNPVQLNGKSISETKRITLDAGANLNKVEVTYSCTSLKGKVPFTAGLVKRKCVTIYSDKNNRWISLYGLATKKNENGSIGTGIVAKEGVFNGTKEDSVHVLLLGTAELGIPLTYYAGAGWTRSGDFNNADDWNKYLKEFSMRTDSPLKIAIEKK